ncbi:MAG: bifunctional phosphoribosylaminoimidazolecarboxamide formyltransferase/IMP cyclohydrolase [Pirellulaceae bacterium]
MSDRKIRRALISVSDKLGLADFARGLASAGIRIYSTGGTRRHLENEGLDVEDISAYTGFPEMMDGRLKTLHPKVFGGILCRPDRVDDMEALDEHDILSFELVVVNLYPFEATISRPGVTSEQAVEQIDIGGPSLVRAAAKNHAFVTVATRPEQYSAILEQVNATGATTLDLRRRLMREAFGHTAVYDRVIADYFASQATDDEYPANLNLPLKRKAELRYGENPHQQAAVYSLPGCRVANIVSARQIHGKELSYNNLLDLDSALAIVRNLLRPACSVIKHNNPCGAAVGGSLSEAVQKALDGDPLSAFGSVLAMNRTIDEATAEVLAAPGLFIEAIVAPDFEAAAVGILTTRPKWKNNVRLMQVGRLDESPPSRHYRYVEGGMLVQQADVLPDPESQWQLATRTPLSEPLREELRFAWSLVRHVKSNAIVLSRDGALCGVGAGQMSRVDSVEIAINKAGRRSAGAVLGSDAFFPFPDSIERAAKAGIAAVIQPGGSKNDAEVIAACDAHGIPMILTGRRHFKH